MNWIKRILSYIFSPGHRVGKDVVDPPETKTTMNPEFLDFINSQVKDINAIRLSEALKALASFYLQLSTCATLKIINK